MIWSCILSIMRTRLRLRLSIYIENSKNVCDVVRFGMAAEIVTALNVAHNKSERVREKMYECEKKETSSHAKYITTHKKN